MILIIYGQIYGKKHQKISYFKKNTDSKEQFEKLILFEKIKILSKVIPIYDSPEWGFPKGRRNLFEKNIDCAIRELEEETTIKPDDVNILTKIGNVVEQYIGSNNVEYRHIYYLSYLDDESYNDEYFKMIYSDIDSNYEVGSVRWFNWDEAIHHVREYYVEKIKVINMIYFLFLNLYMEYITKENLEINQ